MENVHPGAIALAAIYVGGEAEMQNQAEGYLYRGKISGLELVPACGHNGPRLKLIFEWMLMAVNTKGQRYHQPIGGWIEDPEDKLELTFELELPVQNPDNPNEIEYAPNLQYIGNGRMAINQIYHGELLVLFPKDASKIAEGQADRIKWREDGPKAKADKAREEAALAAAAEEQEAARLALLEPDEQPAPGQD